VRTWVWDVPPWVGPTLLPVGFLRCRTFGTSDADWATSIGPLPGGQTLAGIAAHAMALRGQADCSQRLRPRSSGLRFTGQGCC